MIEDAVIAVIAYGILSRSVLNAVKIARFQGIKTGLIKLLTVWPFLEKQIQTITKNTASIVQAMVLLWERT